MTRYKGATHQINISQVIEERTSKRFALNLIGLTFLLMIIEGFDVASLSYVAPVLMKDWALSSSSFGVVFGASTFGLMIGGFLFGYLGDKIGRKSSLMMSVLTISIFTLATLLAESLTSLIILRFFVGLGLGGTVPLSIVLVNEYAPKNAKGRWVAIMFTGFPLGMSIGGILAAWLLTYYDWHSVFIVGGIAPFIMLIILYYKLPESLSFLVAKGKDETEIKRLVTIIKPEMKLTEHVKFIVDKIDQDIQFTPKVLFANKLRIITPLIWVVSIISSFVVYFLNSWMPQLLISSGLTLAEASMTTSLYHLAGILGGPTVGWLIDRYGMLTSVFFPVLACLVTGMLGYPFEGIMLSVIVALAGFFVIGTQGILTVSTPMFYPTAFRAKGNGIAMGIAKVGSIFGPVIGGILLANLTLGTLFLFNSGIISIVIVLLLILSFLSKSIFNKGPAEYPYQYKNRKTVTSNID